MTKPEWPQRTRIKIPDDLTIMWPKISIITPSFNQGLYVEYTILSVLDQNYPNLEYVVIDGGSTDNSVDIIKKYQSHLSYWVSEKDDGLYHALNKGFQRSTGTILMWLNSDDMLHPGALFNVAEIFEKFPNVNWITGINTYFDERGRVTGFGRAHSFTKYDFFTYKFKYIQQESTAWRRTLWEETGGKFDSNIKFAGDLYLWVQYFRYTRLYACDILIGGFRIRSGNQISFDQGDNYLKEANKIIELERATLNKKDRRLVFYLESINLIKKILKYSIVFDWYVFKVILGKIEKLIHKKQYRIYIDGITCQFELG